MTVGGAWRRMAVAVALTMAMALTAPLLSAQPLLNRAANTSSQAAPKTSSQARKAAARGAISTHERFHVKSAKPAAHGAVMQAKVEPQPMAPADNNSRSDNAPGAAVDPATLPTVSLITCGPGMSNYLLEGHSALRLRYPSGVDMAVNWGLFDFTTPNFAYRFIKGETDYMAGADSYERFVASYRASGRYVKEQVLNLTDAEKARLVALIEENLRPENRTYRYNYVVDNCATRPLAMIERALEADSCALAFDIEPQPTTWRREMRQYHSQYPAYQLFIDLVLGSGLDREISLRERAFAPIFLNTLVANARVVDPSGNSRPLVVGDSVVSPQTINPIEEGPSPWLIVVLLTALSVWVTVVDLRRGRVLRWFDALFYGLFGLVGLLLTFLIFVSTHEATSPNFNYLWLNPLALIVPALILFKRAKKVVFYYQILNFVAVVAFVIAYPLLTQVGNWMFVPLIAGDLLLSGRYIYLNREFLSRK